MISDDFRNEQGVARGLLRAAHGGKDVGDPTEMWLRAARWVLAWFKPDPDLTSWPKPGGLALATVTVSGDDGNGLIQAEYSNETVMRAKNGGWYWVKHARYLLDQQVEVTGRVAPVTTEDVNRLYARINATNMDPDDIDFEIRRWRQELGLGNG